MAHKLQYTRFLLELSDLGCEIEIPSLRDCAREILRCIPAGMTTRYLHLLLPTAQWSMKYVAVLTDSFWDFLVIFVAMKFWLQLW